MRSRLDAACSAWRCRDLYVRLVASGAHPRPRLPARPRSWPTTRSTTTTSSSSGAGGAGLRATIEAKETGLRTCCHLPVAHRRGPHGHGRGWHGRGDRWATCGPRTTGWSTSATPCAAARYLNNWRMAADSTPRRRRTGSTSWSSGAPSSTGPRTGKISRRGFPAVTATRRLAHVGDRTGLELIRTLQQKVVSDGHRRLHGVQGPDSSDPRRRCVASPAASRTGVSLG